MDRAPNTPSDGSGNDQREGGNEQLEVLNRIAARLDALTAPPVGGSEDSTSSAPMTSSGGTDRADRVASPRRRRRFAEVTAMAAVVIAACAIVVALLGPTPAKAATTAPPKKSDPPVTCTGSAPKLTVQGTGTATASPDLLTLVLEVDVTEPNAQDALSADNVQAAAIEHALGIRGVSAKDIQTTNLSIQPNYSWQNNTSVLTGYAVSNNVTVNFHAPFKGAGSAIDAIAGLAGNDIRIDGLNFSFSNPATVEDQARTNAVTQAVAHAGTMAQAAGEQLGAVCSVTDDSTVPQDQPVTFGGYNAAAGNLRDAATTPLQPGSQQETDQVTVVYALKTAS
jgi:uncharacterized protein